MVFWRISWVTVITVCKNLNISARLASYSEYGSGLWGHQSSVFPLVSGNCVVISAANRYPAAHK
jgi:hypothetical protein